MLCDLHSSVISLRDRYAASVGAVHYNTSAKLNRGIDELFLDLAKRKIAMYFLFQND